MRALVLVGFGGAAGAIMRYQIGVLAHRALGSHFAFGTLIVNVIGCLALGFLLELGRGADLAGHASRLLLAVGFLGAFTTFSTFGYETVRYLQSGASHLAMLNVSANMILGLGAVWLGFVLARGLMPVG